MKTDVFRPCKVSIWDGTYFTVTPDDPATEIGYGTEFFRICKKRMQNDVLPDPLGRLSKQLNGCLKFRSSPMEGRSVTRHSHVGTSPIYIALSYRRMDRNSLSLEEGYSIPLFLRLRH